MNIRCFAVLCFVTAGCARHNGANPDKQTSAVWHDPSPHKVQFINVDTNVKLEVLDWGGSGRPVVLLTGIESTAHIFDDFAPKLTPAYHVYGITRRGQGASSVPASGYSADRLADDVLEVVASLKLNRPVLVGASIGGEELSSVGSRHPEKVAGLIYLDGGYGYAFYDRARGDFNIDLKELQKHLEQLKPWNEPQDKSHLVQELLTTSLPRFQEHLRRRQKKLEAARAKPADPSEPTSSDRASFPAFRSWLARVGGITMPESELRQLYESTQSGGVGKPRSMEISSRAIYAGQQKHTDIRVPVLAIYAIPPDGSNAADTEAQAKAFEKGVPSARVVRLHANHLVFLSNEAVVLRELHAFLGSLPQR